MNTGCLNVGFSNYFDIDSCCSSWVLVPGSLTVVTIDSSFCVSSSWRLITEAHIDESDGFWRSLSLNACFPSGFGYENGGGGNSSNCGIDMRLYVTLAWFVTVIMSKKHSFIAMIHGVGYSYDSCSSSRFLKSESSRSRDQCEIVSEVLGLVLML